MANKREVFTILENDSTAEGVKLPARQAGDSYGGNSVPVIGHKNAAGNFIGLDSRQVGAAGAGLDAQPGLVASDLAGNLQYIALRDEGAAASGVDSVPSLVAKDASGNLAYIKLNADGEVLISGSGDGSSLFGDATVVGVLNTATTVVNLALVADEVYEAIEFQTACTFPVYWELVQVDDAVLTVVSSWITGAGAYTFANSLKHLVVTAGSTGTQQLRIRGTQLQGAASDMHAHVGAFQKA